MVINRSFYNKIIYVACIDNYNLADSNRVGKLAQLTLGVG